MSSGESPVVREGTGLGFHPARWVAAALGLASIGLFSCGGCSVGTQQGYAPVQPVAYSHALHAGEYQLDCRYCHFGAEKSRHAGVPPLSVCMNCHEKVKRDSPEVARVVQAVESGRPIEWVKVHRLPDHAFFSHASHVAAQVKCQTCHGPVETMVRVEQVETMNMGWCLDCHRRSSARDGVTPPTDCSACHR